MNKVKIGWSKKEFSLNEPVDINGQMYMRRCYGIHDPLLAVAVVIDGGEGNDAVIFCSLDVTVLRGGIIEGIQKSVKEKCSEIPVENIILNATHTHSSMNITTEAEQFPDGSPLFNSLKTRPHIIGKATEAIIEAWNNRKEGGIAFGYGYAVVAHSRRSTYLEDMGVVEPNPVAPNGHAVMYGKSNKPEFAGYEAGADHFLNALYTLDKDDKLTGVIINVPCPSQLSEHFYQLSADFWNEVRVEVAKEFGEDVYVLPQCAAAGDLSPRILHYRDAQRRRFEYKYGVPDDYDGKIVTTEGEYIKVMGERRDIAERIIESVKEIYSWAKKDIRKSFPVRHETKVLDLKRRMITDEEAEWLRNNIENLKNQIPDISTTPKEEVNAAISRYNSIKGRNERALTRYGNQNEQPTLPSRIHCVQIGDIAFVTERFELFMDFMHRVQARSPFIQTFVVQLAGEENGNYLATNKGIANKGYSASLFDNMVSAEGGQQIVEAWLEILEEMKAKDEA